ncbi:hypothetical protein Ct61P_06420 [Colletotrichum tofieldiae]|nr:hypothetical protein Ct61P_06420 [Colletotrichum tofieldiae]
MIGCQSHAALKASGLAMYPNGVTVSELGLTDESLQQALLSFKQTTAEVFEPSHLLKAWAVIRLARKENWPQRAVAIGNNLRHILKEIAPDRPPPLGCAALLFLSRTAAAETCVTGASAGDAVVRWFPFMDSGMEDYNKVRSLFGPGSQSMRADMDGLLSNVCRYCVVCGDVAGVSSKSCATCKGVICKDCLDEKAETVPRHEAGTCLEPLDVAAVEPSPVAGSERGYKKASASE